MHWLHSENIEIRWLRTEGKGMCKFNPVFWSSTCAVEMLLPSNSPRVDVSVWRSAAYWPGCMRADGGRGCSKGWRRGVWGTEGSVPLLTVVLVVSARPTTKASSHCLWPRECTTTTGLFLLIHYLLLFTPLLPPPPRSYSRADSAILPPPLHKTNTVLLLSPQEEAQLQGEGSRSAVLHQFGQCALSLRAV